MDHEEEGIWKYALGFGCAEMAVVRCAIDLGIADFIETQQQPVTLDQISSALGCSPSSLHRILRFLINRGFFNEVTTRSYAQNPLSALLRKEGEKSMVPLIMMMSDPAMVSPWLKLSARVASQGDDFNPFVATNGKDLWEYAEGEPAHRKLIEEAMACHARLAIPAVVAACPDLFDGFESVVDVGGSDGTTIGMLVKAFPGIKGINFDLPRVVSAAPPRPGVQHVGGDMFQSVPKADVACIMWVLNDWGDKECVQILKNCKEAIPAEKGKVILLETIMGSDDCINNKNIDSNKNHEAALLIDMAALAITANGKIRTEEQWFNILTASGFKSYTIKHTSDVVSVIQAFP